MISSSSPSNINVYGQAVLKLAAESPQKQQISNINSILFPIKGELCGFVVCETSKQVDFSLFVESMNILLGQLLTNLETESDLFCELEPPLSLIKDVDQADYKIATHLEYELYTLTDSYNCKVHFYANPLEAKEV